MTATRKPLRCRIGWHRFPTWWPNVAPLAGGGPMFVLEECERCGHEKLTRNFQ